ncbi:MAG TPA: NADH-quinone oxidoreductase subunit M [Bacteroidales bacterium]|nr:NADH-quinone oxidoreductase subunit M [Bacteroidales bacterium]
MITGLLLLIPLFTALLIFILKKEELIRKTAFFASLVMFIIAIYGSWLFVTDCSCQWLINLRWIQYLGINLRFGMDGISLLLILLTTFLFPLIILFSWTHTYHKPSVFYGLVMMMEMAFIGVFTAYNALVFYIFWELALIPAYFICAVWGGDDRIRITLKFFIYTFVGSLFMLAALIFLYYRTPAPHSFDLIFLYMANLNPAEQNWIFLAFFITFAVKIPIFPLHTWQPDTYTVSPPEGTMLLSGIMLKMGTYGLLRFLLPIAPMAVKSWGLPAMILAVIGIIYASVIALRRQDMKRLVAYSSIAHVGLIAAAILAVNVQAMQGAVIQMFSHGVNIVGLFMIISMIEDRAKTRNIASLGGIAAQAPWLAIFFMIILLGSIGLPLTNGFVGEFLMLAGLFKFNVIIASVAGLTIIFSAVYMLSMYQKTMYGNRESGEPFPDLTKGEMLTLLPIILMIFFTGIFPGVFLKITEPAVMEIINLIK